MRDTISRINRMILAIRDIRAQIYEQDIVVAEISEDLHEQDSRLYDMETILTSYEAEYRMQYHAIPIKLDDKLYALAGRTLYGERPPTESQKNLFDEYALQYSQVEASMKKFIDEDLHSFNNLFESAGVEPISIPADTTSR